ncbi:MAG: hypothetical protein NTU41_00505 [Chloroflexi bacterium]|nr:hypothetical protein [Chloroflexota bacterium]
MTRKHPQASQGRSKGRDAIQPKGAAARKAVRAGEASGWLGRLWQSHWWLVLLVLIAGLSFAIRCLHLFYPGHYYMISADSYLFHWMADRIMQGQSIPTDVQASGLAYPMAYLATAISFVFRVSDESALTFVSKFLPPFLSVITVVVLYLAASKIWNRAMGLCSALCWAVLPHAYFIQGAGYTDRDGLNVLLILVGVLVFFLSRRWHVRIRGRDLGWVLAAVMVVGIEAIIFIEWSWLGAALLLAVITAYSVCDLVVKLLGGGTEARAGAKYDPASQRFWGRVRGALRESTWQPLAIILGLTLLAALADWSTTSHTISFIRTLISIGSSQISEMQGMGLSDLLMFQFFLLLIPIGFFLALVRHKEGDILCVSWFLVLLLASLFGCADDCGSGHGSHHDRALESGILRRG